MSQDGLNSTIKISVDGKDGLAELHALSEAASKFGKDAAAASAAAKAGSKSEDEAAKEALKSIKEKSAAQAKYANQLRDLAAMEIFGGRQSAGFIAWKAEAAGVGKELQPMIDSINKTRAANEALKASLVSTGKPLNEMGLTAGQLSNSLRGVPAQFTDIVVSLQSGQKPLTVLMQQGGQLKDMFGGVGNALRAMGGYVLGLVNPFTITAGVVGTLGYAFYAGRKESEEFNKALVMSGNAAGTTLAQLQGLAITVGKAAGQTTGAAAEALAQFATNGNIASGSFEKFAAVALKMQKETGVAVADTVKQFAELGKDPLAATLKLNDQYHYLTLSVYDQIKALEQQGKTFEAGTVAQNAFSDAMTQRMPQLKENLGLVEQAWRGVAGAAKGAWDAMLNVGRTEDAGTALKRQIAEIEAKIADNNKNMAYNPGGYAADNFLLNEKLKLLKASMNEQFKISELNQAGALATAEQNRLVKAQVELDKEHEKYQGKAEQKQREVNALAEKYLAAADTPENAKKYLESLAAIEKKFKEVEKAKPKTDEWESSRLKAYTAAMGELAKIQGEAGAKAQDLSKTQAELLKIQSSPQWESFGRQQKEQIIYAASLAQAQEDNAAALKETVAERDKYVKSLESSASSAEKNLEKLHDETEAYALSVAKHISLAEAIDLVAIKRLEEAKAIEMSYGDDKAVAAIQREIDARKKLRDDINKHDIHKAEVDAAKEAEKEWKRTSESINNTLTDALMRAFEGGASFAKAMRDTVVNMFKTMVLRPVINAVMTPISLAAAGLFGSASASAAGGASGGGGGLSGLLGAMGINTGYFTNIGAASVGGIASTGAQLYSKGFETLGSTMMDLGNGLAKYADAITTAGNYMGYASALYSASQGKWGEAIGAGIGTYFGGPIGAWIGSKIGSWIDSYFGGETRSGGTYKYNPNDGTGFSNGPSGGQIAPEIVTKAINSTVSAINGMLEAIGSQSHIAGFIAGLETSSNNRGGVMAGGTLSSGATFGQNGSGSVYDGTYYDKSKSFNMTAKEAADAFGLELDQVKIKALEAASDLPKIIGSMLKDANGAYIDASKLTADETAALLKQIDAVITDVLTFQDAAKLLPFKNLANLSFDAAAGLIAFSGGMDKLGSNLNTYYDKYFSPSEQRVQTVKNVTTTLEIASVGNPFHDALVKLLKDAADPAQTAETADALHKQFRTIAESLDLTTESGQKTFAAMMMVAGAFDSLEPAATAATAAIDKTARSLNDIANERKTLQDQLDNLTMTSAQLLEKQRNAIDESNKSLFDQVQLAKSAKDAADALAQSQRDAAAAAEALAKTNKSWQNQLDILIGTSETAAGLETERAIALRDATDDSTRAIMNLVYAAQDLATAADVLRAKNEAIANQRYSLETRLLELQGNTVELRRRELELIDPANQALQQSIWALEDAKAAQEAYNAALSSAESRFATASSALDSAQNAVDSIRESATSSYLAAQDKVAAAQQRIADITATALHATEQAALDSALKMRDLGKSLREFVGGNLASPMESFSALLTKALGGDQAAMGSLSSAATAASQQATLGSATSADARLANARIMAEVMRVAKMAESTKLPTVTSSEDQLTAANKELAAAQLELATALSVANTIGASTVRSVEDLVGQFAAANAKLDAAKVEFEAAKQVLEDIKKNTAATVDSVKELNGKLVVELSITAKSEIEKLIAFVSNTDKLPADLKALALSTGNTFTKMVDFVLGTDMAADVKATVLSAGNGFLKTINYVLASDMNPVDKGLILSAGNTFVKTINYALGEKLPAVDLATILSSGDTFRKTIDYVLGSTLTPEMQTLVFSTGNDFTKTINLVAGSDLTATTRSIVLSAGDNFLKTIDLIVRSDLSESNKKLVLSAGDTFTKTIDYAIGLKLPTLDLAIIVSAGDTFRKTIDYVVGSTLTPEMQTLVFSTGNDFLKTINLVAGADIDATTRSIILSAGGDFIKTIDLTVRSDLSDSNKRLVLSSGDTFTKTIDYAIGLKLPASDMALISSAGDTFSKTINYLIGSDLSAEMKSLVLSTGSSFLKTINLIVGADISGSTRTILLASGNSFLKTIDLVVGSDLSASDKALVLSAGNNFTKTIDYAIGAKLSVTDLNLIASTGDGFTKTINLVMGSTLSPTMLTMVLGDVASLSATVNLAVSGNTSAEMRRLVLDGAGTYNATVSAVIASDMPTSVKNVILTGSGAYVTTISSVMSSTMTEAEKTILLNSSSTAYKAVQLSAAFSNVLTADQIAALNAVSSTVSKTINESVTLGPLTADQSAALNAASGTVSRTVQALVDSSTLTDDQKTFLKMVTGVSSSTVTLSGTVNFAADDPMRSVFNNISATNDLLVEANKVAARSTLYQEMWLEGIFNSTGWVWGSGVRGDGGGLKVQFYRDTNGGTMFARGGAFTNSVVSRPTSFSMGTMGEAGPEAIMPLANVNGMLGVRSANDETAKEVRALRDDNKAQAKAMVLLQQRLTKIVEHWDGNGMPELRVVA